MNHNNMYAKTGLFVARIYFILVIILLVFPLVGPHPDGLGLIWAGLATLPWSLGVSSIGSSFPLLYLIVCGFLNAYIIYTLFSFLDGPDKK